MQRLDIANNSSTSGIGLEVMADGEMQLISSNQASAFIGNVNVLDTPSVRRDFTLRNTSSKPLEIDPPLATCGCISTFVLSTPVASDASNVAPVNRQRFLIEPGTTLTVRVSLNPTVLPPGSFLKTVQVFAHGFAKPAVLLTLSGRILPILEFQPAFVDFGDVPVGQAIPQKFTVTVSSQLAETGRLPPLRCSNPAIHIKTIAQSSPATLLPFISADKASVTQTYLLTLDEHAALGPLSGTIFFAPDVAFLEGNQRSRLNAPADAGETATQRSRQYLAVWTKPNAFIVGQIIGDVQARPSLLVLGSLATDRQVTGRIQLIGKSSHVLEHLQVSCCNSSIILQLEDTAVMSKASHTVPPVRMLSITLASQAAPGILQANVIVKLEDGQTLLIPVSAFVPSIRH